MKVLRLPITPPESGLDPNLQSLFPHYLQLNPTSILKQAKLLMLFVNGFTRTSFRLTSGPYKIVYEKQRVVRNFKIREPVSVVVLALDRAFTNDKRIFRASQTSPQRPQLQDLEQIRRIRLQLSNVWVDPQSKNKTTHYYRPKKYNTTNEMRIFCKCREKCSGCLTWRCACFEAEAKWGAACYERDRNSESDCPNIAVAHLRSQKRLRVRDEIEEVESSKRQRRGMVGRGKE